jgi:hypothetical protein
VNAAGRPAKYPFADLEIGRNFLCRDKRKRRSLVVTKRYWERKTGAKYRTETCDWGVLVWRDA